LSARTKARKRALDALFSSTVRGISPAIALEELQASTEGRENQSEIQGYASEIVSGYLLHADSIDAQIQALSDEWKLDRMPAVDRSLLRLASWEILYNPEVPDLVAIAEAVELAKEYSTEDSGKFLNGLLSRLSRSNQEL
jgi:N utilization substance protein B